MKNISEQIVDYLKIATLDDTRKQLKWDMRFLELAKLVSSWSKDPSTQTGAVIVDKDKRVISVGFNGFPRGVEDSEADYNNREIKYKKIVHCEMNAILFANRNLDECCLYTYPFLSCSRCSVVVIQSGIKRVVGPKLPDSLILRWGEEINLSKSMFAEAGIIIVEI